MAELSGLFRIIKKSNIIELLKKSQIIRDNFKPPENHHNTHFHLDNFWAMGHFIITLLFVTRIAPKTVPSASTGTTTLRNRFWPREKFFLGKVLASKRLKKAYTTFSRLADLTSSTSPSLFVFLVLVFPSFFFCLCYCCSSHPHTGKYPFHPLTPRFLPLREGLFTSDRDDKCSWRASCDSRKCR